MIRHDLYSLDEQESEIVAHEIITQMGLAEHAIRTFMMDTSPEDLEQLREIVASVDRRFSDKQLHASDENVGRRYGTPWPRSVFTDLRLVIHLVYLGAMDQSRPEYWEMLGMPESEGLAEMRRRTCDRIRPLEASLDATLKEVAS
jgi:hypothetical protein